MSSWQAFLQSGGRAFLPWNFPSYVPLNAFHGLLHSVLNEDSHSRLIKFDFTESSWSSTPARDLLADLINPRDPQFFDALPQGRFGKSKVVQLEQEVSRSAPAHLEFHHTRIPIPSRPFVLHCETVESLFFPVLRAGKEWGDQDWDRAEGALEALVAMECLAVVTHVTETMEILRRLLNERGANGSKVQAIPIEMLDREVQSEPRDPNSPHELVFTSSMHHDPANFVARGGVVVLNALSQIRLEFPDFRLTIVGPVPGKQDLISAGVTEGGLSELAQSTHIPTFVKDAVLDRILGQSSALLLPSRGLHSATIRRAIRAGATPVVTKIPGIESVIRDSRVLILSESANGRTWTSPIGTSMLPPQRFMDMREELEEELEEGLRRLLSSDKPQHGSDLAAETPKLDFELHGALEVSLPGPTHTHRFVSVESSDFEKSPVPQTVVNLGGLEVIDSAYGLFVGTRIGPHNFSRLMPLHLDAGLPVAGAHGPFFIVIANAARWVAQKSGHPFSLQQTRALYEWPLKTLIRIALRKAKKKVVRWGPK